MFVCTGIRFSKRALDGVLMGILQTKASGNLPLICACGLNQVNLMTGKLVRPPTLLACVPHAYCSAKLQRAGNYFMRLVFGISVILDDKPTILYTPPSESDLVLRDMVLDMFLTSPRLQSSRGIPATRLVQIERYHARRARLREQLATMWKLARTRPTTPIQYGGVGHTTNHDG